LVAFNLCELHGHAWIQQAKDKMGGNNSIHEIRIWKQCVYSSIYIYVASYRRYLVCHSKHHSRPLH
jgi:hypothetical protein